MPRLARITLFPIKSLDGVDVASARILAAGPLEFDRCYALFDAAGRVVHAKRTAEIQRVRAEYSDDLRSVTLWRDDPQSLDRCTFDLQTQVADMARWLSDALHLTCTLRRDSERAFPDDPRSPGPTILSTATLAQVAYWFDVSVAEARRRFRANLEIDDCEPFWEDRLFGASPQRPVRFRIGEVHFYGINPCERCVVPSRNSTTGVATQGFVRKLAAARESQLPSWTDASAFDHFYRLAVNTRLASTDALTIRAGGDVRLASQ